MFRRICSSAVGKVLDYRINIFTYAIIFVHKFTNTYSPIRKELIINRAAEQQLPTDQQQGVIFGGPGGERILFPVAQISASGDNDDDCDYGNWWIYLARPITLFRLIKRYHSVNNFCILLTLLHIIALVYLSSKSVYYQFIIDRNAGINNNSNSSSIFYYYFPRILASYPHPEDYYPLTTYLNLYSLFLRLYSTRELIKQSVLNRNGYVNVKITQFNISTLAFKRWPIKHWIRLFSSGYKHKQMSSTDKRAKAVHLKFNEKLVNDKFNINTCHRLDIQSNLIDFDTCYRRIGLTMEPSDWIRPYHVVRPVSRIDPYEFNYLALLTVTAWPCFMIIVVSYLLYIWHHEYSMCIATTMGGGGGGGGGGGDDKQHNHQQQQTYLTRRLMHFLMSPNYLIRWIDFSFMAVSQVPQHIDASVVYFDLVTMISRVRKVYEALEDDLKIILHKAREHKRCVSTQKPLLLQQLQSNEPKVRVSSIAISTNRPTIDRNSLPACGFIGDVVYFNSGDVLHSISPRLSFAATRHHQSLPVIVNDDNYFGNMDENERNVLNNKLELHIKFASLISNEFASLKRSHTSFLNIYIAGSGILLATTISALYLTKTNLGRYMVLATMASGTVPLVICLVCCVLTERAFRQLYLILCKLLVNEGSYIQPRILSYILLESRRYQYVSDRTFKILGQYPIAPSTVGPYIAYLTTCIILASRRY